jgi:hypothetical protein
MPGPVPSTRREALRSTAASRPTTCLALHAYQPPNIPDAEIEQNVRSIYLPVLAVHAEHAAPLTLNVQGCLVQRLRTIAPHFLKQVRELAHSKLLELATSAHYHPCLPLLPRDRRKQQIASNLRVIQELLDVQPRGFWPPELAWSPALGEQLVDLDLRWTIVDGSAFVRAWSFERPMTGQPAALYFATELMRPYALGSAPGLIAVPRQHEWSRRLLEGDAFLRQEELEASLEMLRTEARGLVCLATDAERITAEALRGYGRFLHSLAAFSDLSTISTALDKHPHADTVDLPVWTWRGALDEWVRGEGERSFLRELDDACRRRAALAPTLRDPDLAAALDDSLMQAESSCWLFWRSPCRFLAEGFAQIQRANRMMDAQ